MSRSPFNCVKSVQTSRDISSAWLTAAQIANHLNLFEDESQDDYLAGLDLAVRQAIEDYLGMPVFSATYLAYYGPEVANDSPMVLDLPATSQSGITIQSLSYYNSAFPAALTAIPSGQYYYDPSGDRVVISALPTLGTGVAAPLVLAFTTLASPLANYPAVKHAGLLLLTHLYNQRSNTSATVLREIPFGVSALLRPYKPLVM